MDIPEIEFKKAPKGKNRQLRPEFFRDDRLTECSMLARQLYLCLSLYSNEEGEVQIPRHEYQEVFFPQENIDRFALLSELEAQEVVEVSYGGAVKLLWMGDLVSLKIRSEASICASAARRAAARKAIPPWACRESIKALYAEARRRKGETGETWHVDHVIPLQGERVCGLHVAENLQVIPAEKNIQKSNRFEVL